MSSVVKKAGDFLGDVGGRVLGGEDKSAQREQKRANRDAQAFIEEQAELARSEIKDIFGTSFANRALGQQQTLDVIGGSAPSAIDALRGGNIAAQQQLSAGLPQIQAALLGLPVDFGAFQPRDVPVNLGFIPQQMPQFTQPLAPPVVDETAEEAAIREAVQGVTETPQEAIRRPFRGTGRPALDRILMGR